jgi:hypothetical protein
MKLRNFVIPVLMVLLALAPLSAQVAPGQPDSPAQPHDRPLDDPMDVDVDPQPVPEEEDPWDVEDDDPVEPDEGDPIVPDEEDPWDVEDDDTVAADEEDQFTAEEETAHDVLARHERTSIAYELFGDEFAEALASDVLLAYFVPADEALSDLDREALSEEELLRIADRHTAAGIVATESVEYLQAFETIDGEVIIVSYDEEGNIILNGVRVIEMIEVSNGMVYIIDGRLDDRDQAMESTATTQSAEAP